VFSVFDPLISPMTALGSTLHPTEWVQEALCQGIYMN